MKWIKVTDKLPDTNKDVLCKFPSLLEDSMLVGCYEEGKWYDYMGRELLKIYNITHWIPLPSPPIN